MGVWYRMGDETSAAPVDARRGFVGTEPGEAFPGLDSGRARQLADFVVVGLDVEVGVPEGPFGDGW